jgi:hypothetical protein
MWWHHSRHLMAGCCETIAYAKTNEMDKDSRLASAWRDILVVENRERCEHQTALEA